MLLNGSYRATRKPSQPELSLRRPTPPYDFRNIISRSVDASNNSSSAVFTLAKMPGPHTLLSGWAVQKVSAPLKKYSQYKVSGLLKKASQHDLALRRPSLQYNFQKIISRSVDASNNSSLAILTHPNMKPQNYTLLNGHHSTVDGLSTI
jgi:hypothetical protein